MNRPQNAVHAMTTTEIAAEISSWLQKQKNDLNLQPHAHNDLDKVVVVYNHLRGETRLVRPDAEAFLEKLRKGHQGRHYE